MYHHLHIKEFIDKNSKACGSTPNGVAPLCFRARVIYPGGSDCDDEFIRFTVMSKPILWRNYGPYFRTVAKPPR